MPTSSEKPIATTDNPVTRVPLSGLWVVLAIGVLIGLLYVPLLHWLGSRTLHTQQLTNGALLVVFALAICVRDAVDKLRFNVQIGNLGLSLIVLALLCFWLAARWKFWMLPLVLLSACLAFAGIVSFLLGKAGVRQFLPAVSAFFVFGVLVGLVPTLDWPLRELSARYAGGLLAAFGVPVRIALENGQPAQLLLSVENHVFVVATECNGFGLLTSSLIVATTLAFLHRLRFSEKLSLWAVSIPIAIVCNFLRILSICLVAPRIPLPYGFLHETLGMAFYFLGLGLIWKLAGRYNPPARRRPQISDQSPNTVVSTPQ
jgi:exosortase